MACWQRDSWTDMSLTAPAEIRMINANGYNVAIWRRNEIVYSLVSDLDEGDLIQVVEAAQNVRPAANP